MTAALEEGEWSAARPGRTLSAGKTRYPFYRRLGGPQGRSGWAENLVLTGIRSLTVQAVVSRKAISITYSECTSIAVFIQHAMRMRRVISPPVICLAVPCFFFTLSQKLHIKKKIVSNVERVLIFSANFV